MVSMYISNDLLNISVEQLEMSLTLAGKALNKRVTAMYVAAYLVI